MNRVQRIAQSLILGSLATSTILTLSQSPNIEVIFTTIYTIFRIFQYLGSTIGPFASISIGESQQIYPIIASWASQRFQNRSDVEISDREDNAPQADIQTLNTTRFMPSFSSHLFWQHSCLFVFVRTQGEPNSQAGEGREARIVLKTLGCSTKPVQKLLYHIVRETAPQTQRHTSTWVLRPNAAKFFASNP
jgi:hypothetical protein